MKHTKKLTLISMLTLLLLTGCGNREPSSSKEPSSVSLSHQQESSSDSSSEEKEEESSVLDSEDSSVTSSPVVAPESNEEVSSATPETESKWDAELVQLMKAHLNDMVLPYVTMVAKKEKIFYEWNEEKEILQIIGGDYLDTYLSETKQVFSEASWVLEEEGEDSVTFKLDAKGILVHFYQDADGFVVLDASLTSVFDSSQFTEWSQEILALFDSKINGNVLPLIYLGSDVPTGKGYLSSIEITGGAYDSRILDLAYHTLTQAGWTAQMCDALPESNSSDSVKAEKTMEDGWIIYLDIHENNRHEAEMMVTWKAPVVIPTTGTWTTGTSQLMTDHLGGHILPYVYLNTDAEYSVWSAIDKQIEISGGAYDDVLLENAKTVFAGDGWTEVSVLDSSVSYQKTFEDGVVKTKVMENDFDHTVLLTASFEAVVEAGYPVPEEATAWSEATIAFLNTYFASYPLPYLYLGALNETAEYNDFSGCVMITGGAYTENVFPYATPILEEDGFTVVVENGRYESSPKKLVADKTTEEHHYRVEITRYGTDMVLKAYLDPTED